MAAPRDPLARIKLIRAALLLADFTAEELAEASGVAPETARDFLKPKRGGGFTEVVDSLSIDTALPPKAGRRVLRHRLAPSKRGDAYMMLAKVGKDLAIPLPSPELAEAGEEPDLSPVALLEAAVGQLEGETFDLEEWKQVLGEVPIYNGGARNYLKLLPINSQEEWEIRDGLAARIEQAMQKFENLQQKFSAESPINPDARYPLLPKEACEPAVSTARYMGPSRRNRDVYDNFLRPLIENFPKWATAGKQVRFFDHLVLVLDGVKGRDSLSSKLIQSCAALDIAFAFIDVSNMKLRERQELYGEIDRLRAATPLAAAKLLVTVDSNDASTKHLIREITDLANPGTWTARTDKSVAAWTDVFNDFNKDRWRSSYVDLVKHLDKNNQFTLSFEGKKKWARAERFVYYSGLMDAFEATVRAESLPSIGPSKLVPESDLRTRAIRVMGSIMCLDIAHDDSTKQKLIEATVRYIPDGKFDESVLLEDDLHR